MTETTPHPLVAHIRNELSTVVKGIPWLACGDVLVSAATMASTLLDLGAEKVLAIGATRGTGPLPDRPGLELLDLGMRAGSMMQAIRGSLALMADLPDAAKARVEAFDPHRRAHVQASFLYGGATVLGRPVLGARAEAWQALEDKMIIDALWDAVGLRRAPSAIVPATLDALSSAADRLAGPMGSVWVGDNREGWHGGATMLRWVRTADEARLAAEFLASHCDRARVMPFLDGIPCSIHAFVLADQVVPLRPCEMLVLRVPNSSQLAYAGSSTLWDPGRAQAAAMRDAVRRVGEHIRDSVGYRGTFTLDGVMTDQGFLPTELNPRFGGALTRMGGSLPELPLLLLHAAIASGAALDLRVADLAALIVAESGRSPIAKGMYMADAAGIEPATLSIAQGDDGAWRVVEDGEAAHGQLTVGPSATGSILFATIHPGHLEPGQSVAPAVCQTLSLAGRHWGLSLPDLTPAPDHRAP
jgi:hypothetical protein